MKDYLIYADVSLDMPVETAKKYNIHFVPMSYDLGDREYTCVGLETETFMQTYYDTQKAGSVTHTSQIAPAQYIDFFRPILSTGQDILYLALSSGLSNTYQSALLASEDMVDCPGKLRVVDTLGATSGMGLLAILAGQARERDASLEEAAQLLERERLNVTYHFMVSDLMYLLRGGRLTAASAMMGSMLNIKPLLRIAEDGRLVTTSKKRGISAACRAMVDAYAQDRDPEKGGTVYLPHGGCREQAEKLKAMVLEKVPDAQVEIMPLSPIIGAHTGPGFLCLIFFGKR